MVKFLKLILCCHRYDTIYNISFDECIDRLENLQSSIESIKDNLIKAGLNPNIDDVYINDIMAVSFFSGSLNIYFIDKKSLQHFSSVLQFDGDEILCSDADKIDKLDAKCVFCLKKAPF